MLLAVLVLVTVQCKPESPGWARRFITERNVHVLENATEVEVFNLGEPINERGLSLDDYEIVRRRVIDTSVAQALASILLDDGSIESPVKCKDGKSYGSIKLCGPFRPSVAVRVTAAKDRIDFLMCFGCGELGLVSGTGRYDQRDMSGGEKALAALLSPWLPEDKRLAARVRPRFPEDAGAPPDAGVTLTPR